MRRNWCPVVALACCWAAAACFAQSPIGLPKLNSPAPAGETLGPYDDLMFSTSPSPYPTTDLPDLRMSALELPSATGAPPSVPVPASARELGLGEYWNNVEEVPAPAGGDQTDVLADAIVQQPTSWYRPSYWFGPTPWDTAMELGINGSSGNNEALSIQSGGYIKRKSRFSKLDLSISYNRTTTGGNSTQNNAVFDARNDWLLDDKLPWTLFGSGEVFYDQFQAFDLQVNANTGVGYQIIDDAELALIGRFGGGASREFGGPDDVWVPEAIVGIEYSQRISNTQKFYGSFEYYPALDELGEYRYKSDLGWEIELVQPSNLSLKIAATDRYDSTPSGVNPHLINYTVLLLLKL